MATMKFTGPADAMGLDGREIKRGDVVDLSEEQLRRLRDAGADLEPVSAKTTKPAAPVKED